MTGDQAMVAHSLEADPALLPYLPELLADLQQLGSDPAAIVRLLAELALPPSSLVIDAGCGKGAVSLAIASALGFRVLGVDLFEPFVDHCRQAAARAGLAGSCEFRHGNIANLVPPPPRPADVLVFAALGDIFGPPEETIALLRRLVKPGGFIVVSDPYLRADAAAASPPPPPHGFESYRSRSETAAGWSACGDSLLRIIDLEEDDEEEESEDPGGEVALIRGRAQALAARHPGLAPTLLHFAESQAAATAYIDANLVDALWLIQKT